MEFCNGTVSVMLEMWHTHTDSGKFVERSTGSTQNFAMILLVLNQFYCVVAFRPPTQPTVI